MPALLHILHQDRADTEMTKSILDTLINLCQINSRPHEDPENDLGMQFTEIYVKEAANVSLLLAVLEETDFHVRYNAVDLLKVIHLLPLSKSLLLILHH